MDNSHRRRALEIAGRIVAACCENNEETIAKIKIEKKNLLKLFNGIKPTERQRILENKIFADVDFLTLNIKEKRSHLKV